MSHQVTQWLRISLPHMLWLLLASTMLSSPVMAVGATLSAKDEAYLKDLARLNVLQVEACELALTKSSNENVRQYAQSSIKEHAQMSAALKSLAEHKQATLPDEPSLWQKAKFRSLSAKDGVAFDRGYAKNIGVKSQEEAVKLLSKIAARAEDADMKTFALEHLSEVESNLETAKALRAVIKATEED